MENNFKTLINYGYVPKDKNNFYDKELFNGNSWSYSILKKIKIWYGTPKSQENEKAVLGIQASYLNLSTGKLIESENHCGDLSSSDVTTSELALDEGDYFSKFNICCDMSITYLKFTSIKGKVLEVGEMKAEFNKTISFNNNENNPVMLGVFSGCYNQSGLKSLGMKYIEKKKFFYLIFMGILRLRHLFKNNQDAKAKWIDKSQQKTLEYKYEVLCKMCLLPDNQFYKIIKYVI